MQPLLEPLSALNEAVLARVLAGRGNRGEFVGLTKKQTAELCKWVDEERERRDRQVNYYEAREKYYETNCKIDAYPRRIGMACRAWEGTKNMRSVETKARQAEEDRLKRQAEEERLKRLKRQAEEKRIKRQAEEESVLLHLRLRRNVGSSESEWYAQLFALPDPEDFYTLREIMPSAEQARKLEQRIAQAQKMCTKESVMLHLRLLRNKDSSESDWAAQLFALPEPGDDSDDDCPYETVSSSDEEEEF